ncbi:hypothetical protein V1L54_13450 [Streptomyces sp. TRM 70361]|uniref:hypothetical protein n=1 Tax=Streptomyces sp. TRM 70361 TaxID=3116553 RepID=UPI002E7B28B8|nr:hypothetical protein [Streptomyces sp. TRM 70361]MEE1940398.1 hypothetical protein [Streptomyces sp. TRM 70361]
MLRKGYAAGAALVALLAAGCTGGSGAGGPAADSKPGAVSAEAATAPPGTHRDLPEPCGTVGVGLLRELLPGAEGDGEDGEDGEDGGATPAAYEGEQTVTYDNDRRVGCRWKSSSGTDGRRLLVDFERIVSYDPAVSDDARAERRYAEMVAEAGAASAPPSGGRTTSPVETGSAEPGRETADGGNADGETPETRPTPGAETAPRALEEIGDAAYLDDELVAADSGVRRDITLVFRTGNVIVTVEYEQWTTDGDQPSDGTEPQERAKKLAERLAGQFDDD